MLTDKKDFWGEIRTIAGCELARAAKTNISIAKTERIIEKLLKADKINVGELGDEWNYLMQEYCSIAYMQGFQDGAKMQHLLLSGEAVNQMYKELQVLMCFGSQAWPQKVGYDEYITAYSKFRENTANMLQRLFSSEFFNHFKNPMPDELFFAEEITKYKDTDAQIVLMYYDSDEVI